MKILSPSPRNCALTLVEVCLLVVVSVIFYMAVMSLASFGHAKQRAMRIQCANNLKQTSLAFDVWAHDHGGKFPMEISETNGGSMEFINGANEWRHFQAMSNELGASKFLFCPTEIARVPATNFSALANSNLSFFLGLDFSHPSPQTLWSGDRNLTNGTPIENGILELTANRPAGWAAELHRKVGNLLLFDGSVQQASAAALRNAIANSAALTNRLQMPVLGP